MGTYLKYKGCTEGKYACDCLSCKLGLASFFMKTIFTQKNNWQSMFTQTQVFERHFLKNEWDEFVISRKATNSNLLPMIKLEISSKNQNIEKHIYHHCELESFRKFKGFLMRLVIILMNVNFFIYNKVCWHLIVLSCCIFLHVHPTAPNYVTNYVSSIH